MADSQSSPFRSVALAIRNQLSSATGVDESAVRIVSSDDYEIHFIEQKFIYVRVYAPVPDTNAGVGRRARPHYRLVRVYIYTRSNLDQVGRDDIALAEGSGHFDFEEQVIDALDEYWPLNDLGTEPLTIEPLHPVSDGGGKPVRKPENDIGLIRSHSDYQVRYVPPVATVAPGTPTA